MRGAKPTTLFLLVLGFLLVLLFSNLTQPAAAADKRDYAPSELLVKFKAKVPTYVMSEIHRGVGARVLKSFRADPRLHQVRIPKGWDLENALAYYRSRADVQYAQPNWVYHVATTVASDPNFSLQWAWQNTGQTGGSLGADVRATAAWDKARGRFTVVVASIDTGVDYLHPDLRMNIWTNPGEAGANCSDGIDNDANGYPDDCRGWNVVAYSNDPRDDNGHGSHTAGTIGALANNLIGVAGANWDVQIMPVKVFDNTGSGFTSWAIEGIDYAVANGAKILNNSWVAGGDDPALLDAIRRAEAAGALFIASAGNAGADNDATPTTYPCAYGSPLFALTPPTNIICVAATDDDDLLWPLSNYGASTVQLGAPGVGILSTEAFGTYGGRTGTSQATAHVSGAAALLKGCKPGLSSSTIKQILLDTARPVADLTGKTSTGGVVDYESAINDVRAAGAGDCDPAPVNALPTANPGGPYNSNIKKVIQFNGKASSDSDGQIFIYFWEFGDGTVALGPRPKHQYAVAATYIVRLTVRDNLGGISTKTTTASIRPQTK